MRILLPLIACLVILGAGGAVMDSLDDFRSDEVSQSYNVTTASGITSANVVLAEPLWDNSVVNATPSSNYSGDSPVASSYTQASRTVQVTGLSGNYTRTLTMTYTTQDLEDYPGVEEAFIHVPFAYMLVLIIVPLLVIVAVVVSRRT